MKTLLLVGALWIPGQLADNITTWRCLGDPRFEEGNRMLPSGRVGITTVKVMVNVGAMVAWFKSESKPAVVPIIFGTAGYVAGVANARKGCQ